MADYKRMYATMFYKITQIIEEWKELQQETEEIYLSTDEESKELLYFDQ